MFVDNEGTTIMENATARIRERYEECKVELECAFSMFVEARNAIKEVREKCGMLGNHLHLHDRCAYCGYTTKGSNDEHT